MAKKQPTLRHFDTPAAVLAYITGELVATLTEDLHRMEGPERQHYTTEDRTELRRKIADVNATIPFITLNIGD